jgi:hypothetical protein
LLRIMAGVDTDIEGEARPQAGIRVGYLPQEPQLDPNKDVRGNIEEALGEVKEAMDELEKVYAAYAEPDADFDALAAKQAELENIIQASDGHNMSVSWKSLLMRYAFHLGTRMSPSFQAVSVVALRYVACCYQNPTCCYSTSRPTTWTLNRSPGLNASCMTIKVLLWPLPTTVTSSIMLLVGFSNSTEVTASLMRATTLLG